MSDESLAEFFEDAPSDWGRWEGRRVGAVNYLTDD